MRPSTLKDVTSAASSSIWCIYLGSNGMVVGYHDVELLLVADSFEDALHVMLMADRPLPVLRIY